jgi:hypothetical protein
MNDPYILKNGTANHYYVKLIQSHNGAVDWFCGDKVTGWNEIPYDGIVGWNIAMPEGTNNNGWGVLWDSDGEIQGVSTRRAKEHFTPLNPDDILSKIDKLEVTRWNYKAQDKSYTHIGPVAEDFSRIFKTGEFKNQLYIVDPIGVSLAGLKALIGKAESQQQQIEELKNRLVAIKSELSR